MGGGLETPELLRQSKKNFNKVSLLKIQFQIIDFDKIHDVKLRNITLTFGSLIMHATVSIYHVFPQRLWRTRKEAYTHFVFWVSGEKWWGDGW